MQRPDIEGYLDLSVDLLPEGKGRGAGVGRITSPLGEAQFRFESNISPADVDRALADASGITKSYVQRASSRDVPDAVRYLGHSLFTALFSGRQEYIYRQSRDIADARGVGLRLQIGADDSDLAILPWEFLHDGRDFLNLSLRTPVVRKPAARRDVSGPVSGRLRMLVVTADLGGYTPVESTLRILSRIDKANSQLETTIVNNPTRREFDRALESHVFEAFHFIGTGTGFMGSGSGYGLPPQGLALAYGAKAKGGQYESVMSGELQEMLAKHDELRLVILNACKTEMVSHDVAKACPNVIGIRGDITVDSADIFMETLLNNLLSGATLDMAVALGRQQVDIQRPGNREWGLPVFYGAASQEGFLAPSPQAEAEQRTPSRETPVAKAASPERRKLEGLLAVRQKNLQALQAQQATANAPSYLESQIKQVQEQIAGIERKLREMP